MGDGGVNRWCILASRESHPRMSPRGVCVPKYIIQHVSVVVTYINYGARRLQRRRLADDHYPHIRLIHTQLTTARPPPTSSTYLLTYATAGTADMNILMYSRRHRCERNEIQKQNLGTKTELLLV